MDEFSGFMEELADDRDKKMMQLTNRLNEERRNRQAEQERLAFGLARVSPSAVFSLAASHLASTAIDLKQYFVNEASGYQATYAEFMKAKTGMNLGAGMMIFKARAGGPEEEEQAIDPNELPSFQYSAQSESDVINASLFDIGLLAGFNLVFFAGAVVAFLRYDVR